MKNMSCVHTLRGEASGADEQKQMILMGNVICPRSAFSSLSVAEHDLNIGVGIGSMLMVSQPHVVEMLKELSSIIKCGLSNFFCPNYCDDHLHGQHNYIMFIVP